MSGLGISSVRKGRTRAESTRPRILHVFAILSGLSGLFGVTNWIRTSEPLWFVLAAPFVLLLLLIAPFAVWKETDQERQRQIAKVEKLEEEQKPKVSVALHDGYREFPGQHEHLLWAELRVSNLSPTVALRDVEVSIIDMKEVMEKQDNPLTFSVMPLILWDFSPFNLLWSASGGQPSAQRTINPGASQTVLVAYSDDSNGPPGTINSSGVKRPLPVETKLTIRITSRDSASWLGEFYIRCHGKYVRSYQDALQGHATNPRFEFTEWKAWEIGKKIQNS